LTLSRRPRIFPPIEIIIRPARESDAPVLARFNVLLAAETEQLTLEPERVLAGVRALFADPAKGLYYVTECRGELVAQLMITYEWSDWRNGNIWWIQSVYVRQDFRGQGLFQQLFRYVQELAHAKKDVCSIRLYLHHDNQRARRSYAALNMQPTHYQIMELDIPRS
jgi:GNAT superfamily N-acetyltransferase